LLITGAKASVLTEEIARPSTPFWIRLSSSAIWSSAFAPTGPTITASTLNSLAAASTPALISGANSFDTS
jgi:hypothetical protein